MRALLLQSKPAALHGWPAVVVEKMARRPGSNALDEDAALQRPGALPDASIAPLVQSAMARLHKAVTQEFGAYKREMFNPRLGHGQDAKDAGLCDCCSTISCGGTDFLVRTNDLLDTILGEIAAATQAIGTLDCQTGRASEPLERASAPIASGARLAALTPRQRAVLDMVIAGKPSKIIAADLGVSQRTIEGHRSQIMRRLGVGTIPELMRLVLS